MKPSDAGTVQAAVDVLKSDGQPFSLARLLPFLGPAFIASVAYMDPGNFATNIQGGAKFGYTLLWVVATSNLMAMLIQSLSAKLGIASGKNLAEMCRLQFPRWVAWLMWVLAELVAMATDLAEFLGAALGFYLLFGVPLWAAGLITAVVTFLILGLERYGFRPLEAVITVLVGVIALCYVAEMILVKPAPADLLGGLLPRFPGTPEDPGNVTASVLLASGILGATVMPHVIYLHSALTQNRIVVRDPQQLRRLYHFELLDVVIAMGMAGLINAAMLIMAARFHTQGLTEVGEIENAYQTLTPLLGGAASVFFGISLLASGLSSSSVGTMSGQVIMQGFLKMHIPIWVRRLVTIAPSLAVIFLIERGTVNATDTLVISQVVLSFGLPFAIIPLVMFTRRKDIMGTLVNRTVTTVAASIVAALIVALNLFLLYQTFFGD